jgi:UDP-glucose 4-epimerase
MLTFDPDPPTLRGSKVLVTGGSGMLGSHVVDLLIDQGVAEIVIVDKGINERNLRAARASGNVVCVTADIRDASAMASAIEGCDVVVHLAALLLADTQKDTRASLEVNLCATFDLLALAVRHDVKRFVYGSSVGVYGQPDDDEVLDESSAIQTRSLYGASKFAAELYCRTFSEMYGLGHMAVRLGTLYGDRAQPSAFALRQFANVLDQLGVGKPPEVEGDPAEIHDFIFVHDAAEAVVKSITSSAVNRSINVVSGVPITWGQTIQALLDAAGSTATPQWQPRSLAWATRRTFDASLATETIGFTAGTSLAEGMRAMVDWRRAEGGA